MNGEPHNPSPDPTDPAESPAALVALTSVKSFAQAATIADALKERGIDASLMDGTVTGHDEPAAQQISILVRRIDLERAELILDVFLGRADRDDWPEFSPTGRVETRDEAAQRASGGYRWAWTLVLAILLPLGGLLTIAGAGPYQDPVMKMVGPATVLVAAMIAVGLIANRPDNNAN